MIIIFIIQSEKERFTGSNRSACVIVYSHGKHHDINNHTMLKIDNTTYGFYLYFRSSALLPESTAKFSVLGM